jgi:hypothetical protein
MLPDHVRVVLQLDGRAGRERYRRGRRWVLLPHPPVALARPDGHCACLGFGIAGAERSAIGAQQPPLGW